MKTIYTTLFMILIGFSSCYYDAEDTLYTSGCDTSSVTFSSNVSMILGNSCLSCHGNSSFSSLGAGIDLEGYDDVKIQVNNGKLLSSLLHDGKASKMPKGRSKLSTCKIDQIKTWIDKGALNN